MNENETWLEVVTRARRLRPDLYREWQFMVGDSGTEEERCRRGQEALKIIRIYPGAYEVKHANPA